MRSGKIADLLANLVLTGNPIAITFVVALVVLCGWAAYGKIREIW